ncbi:phosphoribosylamine--glycine ligase [soil metagenome]
MKILVVGGGGREHALAWKLAQSPKVQLVYVAPGNAGTAADKRLVNVPITDHKTLAAFALREKIELTVVGPDAELERGIVDRCQANGLAIFGPTRAAAELEWSKDFAKGFMARHQIPTAAHATFSVAGEAHGYVDSRALPIVVKADGLAAGKGVVVAETRDDAHAAIDSMLATHGGRVVIEDFLPGEEASFFVVCDGKHAVPLQTAQDHKRLLDGDLGPNTGGMGAYSPAPIVTPTVHARVMQQIVRPALAGMAAEGRPFTGFLYVGLMIDKDGQPRVVEFNARMGDPETQVIMARLKSDFVPLLQAAAAGHLADDVQLEWDRRTALCVVLAAAGYPAAPRSSDPIGPLPATGEDCMIFHAGTRMTGNQLVTSGGRVMAVVGLADTVRFAQRRAYELARQIHFDGVQFRSDIGHRALKSTH